MARSKDNSGLWNLPDCTINSDPNGTADHQKRFFIEKILQLVKSIPSSEGNEYLKCNICDAKFATGVDLKYHVRAFHDGKKPFKCNFCEAQFQLDKDLENHIRKSHEEDKLKDKFSLNLSMRPE